MNNGIVTGHGLKSTVPFKVDVKSTRLFYCVKRVVGYFVVAAVSLFLWSCASSGPQTSYYSLFPSSSDHPQTSLQDKTLSFGVGPIVLPEYMDNPAVVSLNTSQQIRVSGYHAWGGDLKASMSRVLASNLSRAWQLDNVWSFPWDSRARPHYQLRLVFEKFAGERGGNIELQAKWQLYNQKQKRVVKIGTVSLSHTLVDDSVDTYVAGLNALLNQFSIVLSKELSKNFESI